MNHYGVKTGALIVAGCIIACELIPHFNDAENFHYEEQGAGAHVPEAHYPNLPARESSVTASASSGSDVFFNVDARQ